MENKPPTLDQCAALKAAGYEQGIKLGQHYYDMGHKRQLPVYAVCPFKAHDECIAIPTLEGLLDWFIKDFAGRWAEKVETSIMDITFDYDMDVKEWNFYVMTSITEDDRQTLNPSLLTAVIELFIQMCKKMEDE